MRTLLGRSAMVVALAAVLVGLCSSCYAGAYYQFAASQGYVNGKPVYFVATDVSDQSYAASLRVSFTPLLRNALANAYLPSAYLVTNYSQGLVFSAEWPASYAAGSYVPIWVLNTVTWFPGRTPTLLKSVAQIQAARPYVSLRKLAVVLGASILVNSAGTCIPQGTCWNQGAVKMVRLPAPGVYVNGVACQMLQLDFSNYSEALAFRGTYAPMLAQFNAMRTKLLPPAWQNVYSLWTIPPLMQLPVATQVPSPFGPANTNGLYSPLMNEWLVQTLTGSSVPFTSYAAIAGSGLQTSVTNNMSYQPILPR